MKRPNDLIPPAVPNAPGAEKTTFEMQQAIELLNQQVWCWGRDVKSPRGNLLVQHGFHRTEKPAGSPAASLYRLELSSTTRIILRGFGVFCGDDRWGGLFLRRFGFKPKLTPAPDMSRPAWTAEDLPSLVLPGADQAESCQRLLMSLIDWVVQYETWIREVAGPSYRRKTLDDWNARQGVVPAEAMIKAWRTLARAISDQPEQFISYRSAPEMDHA